MSSWLLVLAVAAGSYGLRYSTFELMANRSPPPVVHRAVRLIAPAVPGALLGPALVAPDRTAGAVSGPQMAIVVAFVVVARTRRQLLALAVGLPVIWLTLLVSGLS